MIKIPIICCNGIGDSLLILGRIPIGLLGRLGVRFNVFHATPDNAPAKILIPFYREIKYVSFVEREPTPTERFIFRKMMSFSQRYRHIWPVPHARGNNLRNQPPGSRTGRVLIQTHLDGHHGWKGASAKIWKIENWIDVIKSLHDLKCEVAVMEWDATALAQIKRACPYVIDASAGSLSELCSLMGDFDCVVSVDSWVKYAAAWVRVPQVVLVPDLRAGYTNDFAGISAKSVANWWFHGLLDNPRNRVFGLDKINGQYEFTLGKLDDLKPDLLLQQIRQRLGR